MSFEHVFKSTLQVEGRYSNDAQDSGGKTKYGITEAVARANGYTGAMRHLPLGKAKEIAKGQYWDIIRLDDVSALSERVAEELFDTGYNMGPARAGVFLQRCLNVLNRKKKDYPDVRIDGLIGPVSISALRAYVDVRGEDGIQVLLKALNCLQGARYIKLAESREKDERFVFGWLHQRVRI